MSVQPYEYEIGEMVFASENLFNDGGIPGEGEEALVVRSGARGVVVQVGHPEMAPEQTIYLVQFEDAEGNLGLPVGCLSEELTQDEATVRDQAAA